jgi:outer membrane protein assembly factor BamB
MKLLTRTLALIVALGGLFTPETSAADWPRWRGADNSDHSPDKGLLKEWPAGGPKRAWLNEDVGLGYSGFAVVGGKLFTMGRRGESDFLLALDANTGKELWATKIGESFEEQWASGPRGTPTVDGDRVYALGARGDLLCARTSDGKALWTVSFVNEFGGVVQDWAYTESVLVDGDQVICTPGGSKATMAALDKFTGRTKWQTAQLVEKAHYSSPIVIEHGGQRQYVKLTEKKLFGIQAATGKVLWSADFPGRVAVIPTPIYADGQIYVSAGYQVGCMAVKLAPDNGSVSVVYQNTVMKNHHGGVIKIGDYLYGHSDTPQAGWVCQDWKTGEEVWRNNDLGKGPVHFADGLLYCLEENSGIVALVEPSPSGWKEVSRFELSPKTTKRKPSGRIWTHPVVINGKLYLRDQELLHCYDVKAN